MSSIYDKSSLVLIPSGTKSGKVYSQKPVSGDGDFTFTRSSAATRVNADGNIEKETQNQITYSNDLSQTAWLKYLISITGGQSGYDGTSDAWLLEKSGAYGNVYRNVSNSGVVTWSVYAKAGSYDFLALRFRNTSNNYRTAFFDLSNGTLGSVDSNIIKHTIESVGSGWYRCQIAFNDSAINQVMIYPSDVNNGIANSGTGNIYIQDAQLEQGLVARDVITTTTTAVEGGITDNVPRLDYTDSSCPALLLEPQRTNLYQHSEYIFNFQGTETFNDSNSPEGVSNAVKLTKTSASDQFVNMSWSGSSLTASTDYTLSLFVKHAGDDVDVRYEYNNSNDWGKAWYALFQVRSSGVTASTTSNCTSDVKDYGNGWYRILVFVETASSITPSSPSNLLRVIGASGDDVLVYGAGMEEGSYATSYIPSYGSSVTRNGETCNSAGTSATFNSTEGVLYAEISALYDDQTSRRITISDGTNTNRIVTGYNTSSNQIFYFIIVGGSTIASAIYTTTDITDFHKVAIKYKVNDFALWIDGVERHTDSSGAIFGANTLSEMQFTQGSGSGLNFYGNTKQVIYIPTALTDAELADLTTL